MGWAASEAVYAGYHCQRWNRTDSSANGETKFVNANNFLIAIVVFTAVDESTSSITVHVCDCYEVQPMFVQFSYIAADGSDSPAACFSACSR